MSEIMDENKCRELWQAEAKLQTLETLPGFIKKLSEHNHDYGTICVALGAAALGAAWAMDKTPNGGITGFQAGAIFWEFYRGWMGLDGPARIVKYSEMLFPQYENKFTAIAKTTWEWLQEEAKKRVETENLNESIAEGSGVHPDVYTHWVSIAEGNVPFGLRIEE